MTHAEDKQAGQMVPREIVVTNRAIEYGNIEAWQNVIESYAHKHPDHEVVILYEGTPVHSVLSLFKKSPALNRNGFQIAVSAPDGNRRDIPKLYRYLVEGASPNFRKFIEKEIHQILNLF